MIKSSNGKEFKSIKELQKEVKKRRQTISKGLKEGGFTHNNITYKYDTPFCEEEALLAELKNCSDKLRQVKPYDIITSTSDDECTGLVLLSDWHVDENVDPETVFGYNEYNPNIAKERSEKLFVNIAKMIRRDECDNLVMCLLGDFISGFIHDELAQTNNLTPAEAIALVKELMVSGMKYLCDNTELKGIKALCLCGNHSRNSKKIQHSNFASLSFEYMLYHDLQSTCKLMGLPIEFKIPNSSMDRFNIYGITFLAMHGHQIRGGKGILGALHPAMLWISKQMKYVKFDKLLIGHFHSCVNLKEISVNGSLIGYNSFAMDNALGNDEPKQMYLLVDKKRGITTNRFIFCN